MKQISLEDLPDLSISQRMELSEKLPTFQGFTGSLEPATFASMKPPLPKPNLSRECEYQGLTLDSLEEAVGREIAQIRKQKKFKASVVKGKSEQFRIVIADLFIKFMSEAELEEVIFQSAGAGAEMGTKMPEETQKSETDNKESYSEAISTRLAGTLSQLMPSS